MFRPCFFAPQTFDVTHAFSKQCLGVVGITCRSGQAASKRRTTGWSKRVRVHPADAACRRMYSDGGDVIPVGITSTEARYECQRGRYAPGAGAGAAPACERDAARR